MAKKNELPADESGNGKAQIPEPEKGGDKHDRPLWSDSTLFRALVGHNVRKMDAK